MTDEQQQPPAGTSEPAATVNTEPTAEPTAAVITKSDIEKNKVWAAISYLGLIGIIIALVCEAKDSPFVKFHLNQSVGLLVASLVAFAISLIPILGWILGPLIWLVVLVFMVMGIINAAQGQVKRLPLIGNLDLIK